ncbi:hypothetical protein BB561_005955 [Smittium simulii]|uniref:Ribosomal protein L10 n=1 Tax=Smittium simulii TaxID=133385 RepID=A0A2T9Y7C3_9FUNG|nr:hypothetical protein BB561_005955 [Smittium simulii]
MNSIFRFSTTASRMLFRPLASLETRTFASKTSPLFANTQGLLTPGATASTFKPAKKSKRSNIPLTRKKKLLYGTYEEIFENSPAVLVVQHINLDSVDWTVLRQKLFFDCSNAKITVVKNRAMHSILRKNKYSNLKPLFASTVSVISWNPSASPDSSIDLKSCITKALSIISKSKQLSILGGVVENNLMTLSMLSEYTSLPDIDNLQAQVVGVLQLPSSSLTRALASTPSRLASILSQRE